MLQTAILGFIVLILTEMALFFYVMQKNRLESEALATAIFLAEKRFAMIEGSSLFTYNGSDEVRKNGYVFTILYSVSPYEENVYKGEICIVWKRRDESEGKRSFERLFLKKE